MNHDEKKDEEAPETLEQQQTVFADKVFQAVLGAQLVQTAYLGYKLGWYQALGQAGKQGMTPVELADATKSSSRYAREWLELQTVAGWIMCQDPANENPDSRRFQMPLAHASVLTDELALDYMMPMPVIQAGWGKDIDKLLDAYKNDTGLSWEDMTNDAREQEAAMNRPFFLKGLAGILEESLDRTTVERLKTKGGKVADIGAGYAWSSIGVARHFPEAKVDAYDRDEPSIQAAKKNINIEGLQDRVAAHCIDGSSVLQEHEDGFEPYDLVMALECIHDMNDPISVLKTMRLLSGSAGEVIVMDERVANDFAGAIANNPVEQAMYGFSCMCCLVDGKSRPNSVATGTVMRPSILRMYAQQAGFSDIEILPAENEFYRFYKLLK